MDKFFIEMGGGLKIGDTTLALPKTESDTPKVYSFNGSDLTFTRMDVPISIIN